MDSRLVKRLVVAVAALATPMVVGLMVLSAVAGLSPFGALLGISVVGAWAGALTLPWRRRRGFTRASGALFVVTLALHAITATGNERVQVVTLPERSRSLLASFVPEQDPSLLIAAFLDVTHALPAVERARMIDVLRDGYRRMLEDVGFTPTPATMTWLGGRSRAFDVVEIDPPSASGARSLVVFLHGSGGSFTIECWQVSVAAGRAGFSTWCPSMGIDGDWAGADGARIVDATLAAARARGFTTIVVAGLSAGARGVSFLAAQLARHDDVRGFVLLSGADGRARATSKPTLVIHGTHDALAPISSARAYGGELLELDSNHFVLLAEHERVTAALAGWLKRL